ncbi:DUF805 domain-containing protein [Kumtagia ephedrae]|uniref:DUF805 domain-containing protein n=1 Tax=Kumtagia ephedrae TaxID=2116701 RepID=UPI00140340E7|nr:DUF805 domain-containing protein [Mesorhizobium ephedrae]
MSETAKFIWLCFSFSGRLGRYPYALAGMLCYLARMFPVYRIVIATDEATVAYWSSIFMLTALGSFVVLVPLAAKRLHDFGKPAALAFLAIFLDVLMYLPLCFIPGDKGPNRYGQAANEPK